MKNKTASNNGGAFLRCLSRLVPKCWELWQYISRKELTGKMINDWQGVIRKGRWKVTHPYAVTVPITITSKSDVFFYRQGNWFFLTGKEETSVRLEFNKGEVLINENAWLAHLEWLENLTYEFGHDEYCDAQCGPHGEKWIEAEKCNCWHKKVWDLIRANSEH